VRRSSRASIPSKYYSPSLYYVLNTNSGEPNNFDESIQMSTWIEWELAMKEEIESLHQHQIRNLVNLPRDKRALIKK